jgi:hypothetical protein
MASGLPDPEKDLAIVVATTMEPGASPDGNFSTDLLKEIAAGAGGAPLRELCERPR